MEYQMTGGMATELNCGRNSDFERGEVARSEASFWSLRRWWWLAWFQSDDFQEAFEGIDVMEIVRSVGWFLL